LRTVGSTQPDTKPKAPSVRTIVANQTQHFMMFTFAYWYATTLLYVWGFGCLLPTVRTYGALKKSYIFSSSSLLFL
jgi:hypothetical protein